MYPYTACHEVTLTWKGTPHRGGPDRAATAGDELSALAGPRLEGRSGNLMKSR